MSAGRMPDTDDLPLHVSWFPTAFPNGAAIGDPENTTWGAFTSVFWWRRTGLKDGPLFCPARFKLEADGRHVRRLARNVITRTLVALDVETKAGEPPPPPEQAAQRLRDKEWTGVVYTSHNHQPETNVRYRLVLPLSEEIDPELPAPEVVADALGLSGVLDTSKLGPASVFYLPSCDDIERIDQHASIVCPGAPIDATWLQEAASSLLAARQAEQDRIAAEAHAAAQARLEARIAAGFDPNDSLIEKLRSRLDLASVLTAHGYDRQRTKYRHPNSQSGSYGADIKTFGGIERIYSHNAGDPLHRSNLPDWCGGVTAIDVVDVVTILDFAGDRPQALSELARRFGITKPDERRLLARLILRMVRQNAPQEAIEAAAFLEGVHLGMSRAEVIATAQWCAQQLSTRKAA